MAKKHSSGKGAQGKALKRARNGNLVVDLTSVARKILAGVASGQTVRSSDFARLLGQDADEILTELDVVQIKRVSSTGLEFKRSKRSTHRFASSDVSLDTGVAFEAVPRANGMDLTKVRGVSVNPGPAVPNLDLRAASVSTDSAGNSTIVLRLRVSRLLPDLTHTVVVGPDGKPVGGP